MGYLETLMAIPALFVGIVLNAATDQWAINFITANTTGAGYIFAMGALFIWAMVSMFVVPGVIATGLLVSASISTMLKGYGTFIVFLGVNMGIYPFLDTLIQAHTSGWSMFGSYCVLLTWVLLSSLVIPTVLALGLNKEIQVNN